MEVLQRDLRYLTKSDLMRSPHFIPTILGDLCALKSDTKVTSCAEDFDTFVQKNKASAQKVIESLETRVQESSEPLVVHLPYPVHFLTMAFYAGELRALRRMCSVEFKNT